MIDWLNDNEGARVAEEWERPSWSPRSSAGAPRVSRSGSGPIGGLRGWVLAGVLLVAVVLVAACGSDGGGQGGREEVAVVRGGSLYLSDAQLAAFTPVASGNVVDVAYSADGTLWYARDPNPSGGEQAGRCELYRSDREAPVWRFDQLAGATGAAEGLCTIESDPGGGLLFGVSNHTAGSLTTWRLDPESGQVRELAYGYSPTVSPDGRLVVIVQHAYNEGPEFGSDEALASGPTNSPKAVRRITPVGESYASPALSPDGRQLAAVRDPLQKGSVVVGPPEGPWRTLLAGVPGRRAVAVAWLAAGRSLLVTAQDPAGGPTSVWRASVDGAPPTELVDGVEALAVR